MKIKIDKYENFVKMPNRAHDNDSGADVFATETFTIEPFHVVAHPVGFGVNIPDGYDIVLYCKSGLTKKGIFVLNPPVDAGYKTVYNTDGTIAEKAEIHAMLFNSTNEPYTFNKGDKIAQLVVRPVIYADFVEERGESRNGGAFGSTGK